MKNILDELEVPQPPYRMARLAMAETTPPLTPEEVEHLANQIKPAEQPELSDEERAKKLGEQRVAEQDKEWERFGAEVDKSADAAKQEIRSIPPPPSEPEAQDTAIKEVEDAQVKFHKKITPKVVRTPEEVAGEALGDIMSNKETPPPSGSTFAERGDLDAELKASDQDLNALEEQGKGNTPEAQRLRDRIDFINAQEEELALMKTSPKSGSKSASTIAGFDADKLKKEAAGLAKQEEERLEKPVTTPKPAASEPAPKPEPTAQESLNTIRERQAKLRADGKDAEADSLNPGAEKYEQWIRAHAPKQKPAPTMVPERSTTERGIPYYEELKAKALEKEDAAAAAGFQAQIDRYNAVAKPKSEPIPPKPEPTAQERLDAASKKMDSFRNKKAGTLSRGISNNPEFEKAREEFNAASKALHPEQQATPEPVPLKPENPDETVYRKPEKKGPIDLDDAAREGQSVPGAGRDKRIADLQSENAELKRKLEAAAKGTQETPAEKPTMSRREFMGMPKESFVPEQPENRRERMGGLIGFLREGLRWTIEKTGVRPWLDTLGSRLKAKFHYRMAEVRMMQQSRAQNKHENAIIELDKWTARMQDAGFPMRLFYSNRVRAWQARVNSAEARVDKYDNLRLRWQESHNVLQQQVSERYEQELAPYREKMNALKTKESSLLQARKNLEGIRSTAVKEFAQLRAQATKKHWWQSTKASVEVKRAERAMQDLNERIQQADKEIGKIRGPLAKAKTDVDKWELKKKTVAQLTEFPEAKGLKRPTRKEVPAAPAEAAPASPTEAERFAEEWDPADFVKRWNGNNLKPEIEQPGEFTKFVAAELARLKQTGTPKLGQLLGIAEQYVRTRSSVKDMRQFSKDRRFFIANIQKQ